MSEDVNKLIAENLAALWDAVNENSARLSAQRFLLEQLFANAFIRDPGGVDSLLKAMIESTRKAPQLSSPMQEDEILEQQARIATHLERFRLSVLGRIQGA